MDKSRPRSNVFKLLREHPWLWAIVDGWEEDSELKVRTITEEILLQDASRPRPELGGWWFFATFDRPRQSRASLVRQFAGRQSVAAVAYGAVPLGFEIQYLAEVVGARFPKVTIWRGPKNEDLHLMCGEIWKTIPAGSGPRVMKFDWLPQ